MFVYPVHVGIRIGLLTPPIAHARFPLAN